MQAYQYDDMIYMAMASLAEDREADPKSVAQARRSLHAAQWELAMGSELDSMVENDVYDLVEWPEGVDVPLVMWLFKTKYNVLGEPEQYKARVVVLGQDQVQGIDFEDSFAPVCKMGSLRMIFALAAEEDMELHGMDVKTAFLQAPIEEEVYVRQPPGFIQYGPTGKERVWKLKKSLYGLKQSPRNWHVEIDGWMQGYGFVKSVADPCVYQLAFNDGLLLVGLYVDDLVAAATRKALLDKFKMDISRRYKMKDLGELTSILGMEVRREREKGTIEIRQTAYIDKLLERFGMVDCNSVKTPAEGVLVKEASAIKDKEYMRLVGSLLYAGVMTRPDIVFAVQALSRFMQGAGPSHWAAGKRVLRYLKGTREIGIKYVRGAQDARLVGYADADWGGDKDTLRSTTAYAFMMAGAAVSWASRLQPSVALSSAEAEFMAASAAGQEAVHLRSLLEDAGYKQGEATVVFEDNQGCIGLAKNPVVSQRSKHIDLRKHYIRDLVADGVVVLEAVATQHQLADMMTKPLHAPRLMLLRNKVHGYDSTYEPKVKHF